jgi:hypothetical protein
MGYIKKTGAALKSILKNPLPFVGNLVKAAKLGFQNFGANIGTHLKAGLLDWLLGALPGMYIPTSFALVEIGKFVLSILGITWTQIRGKIVKVLGPSGEAIMKGLETAFDVVVALVKGGPAAAWEVIKEKLNNLKDTVIGGIIDFVVDIVVKKAIPKLISMFIPGAGFISAILSIYDTVMVFVQKLAKIAAVVKGFIDSIVAIAAGQIGGAAAKVESILAGLLSLAISFLAGFVGLGKVADKVMAVITKVRAAVDKALDAAIAWIVAKAKALFGKLFGKDKKDERTDAEKKRDKLAAIAAAEQLLAGAGFDEDAVRGKLGPIKSRFKLLTLNLVIDAKSEERETVHFTASASDEEKGKPKEVVTVAKWPVAKGDTIKNVKANRLVRVLDLNGTITIEYAPSPKVEGREQKQSKGTITTTREQFVALWTAGSYVAAPGEKSAEDQRKELEAKYPPKVVDAIMKRGSLRDRIAPLSTEEAHHILPIEILKLEFAGKLRELVQLGGFDYNTDLNGIPIAYHVHGSHEAYNRYVEKRVQAIIDGFSEETVTALADPLHQLIAELRTLIEDAIAKGQTLQAYFKGK